jgi:hypothetical protein
MPTRRGASQNSKKEPTPVRDTVSGLGGGGHQHTAKTNTPKGPGRKKKTFDDVVEP